MKLLNTTPSLRTPLPLRRRPVDLALVVFFAINLGFITYIVDIEQLIIADPAHFTYPIWPPAKLINLIHWYGRSFDPPLMARPAWWRATIWIDSLLFGPFYIAALYAFVRGRDWIRMPSVVWASVMLTNVTIILFEEMVGPYATPNRPVVLATNAAWIFFPLLTLARMWSREQPFAASAIDKVPR